MPVCVKYGMLDIVALFHSQQIQCYEIKKGRKSKHRLKIEYNPIKIFFSYKQMYTVILVEYSNSLGDLTMVKKDLNDNVGWPRTSC